MSATKWIVNLVLVIMALSLGGRLDTALAIDKANFAQALVQHGDSKWTGERWKVKHGRIGGSTQMMYIAELARLTGTTDRLPRVTQHFRTIYQKHWNEADRCYIDRHHFMVNAEEGFFIAAALDAAGPALPDKARQKMQRTLRQVCAYLAQHSTAADNTNRSMRATNQDAFAAATLALASRALERPAIRRMAIEKVEAIARTVDGGFWVEGGIDRDYQRIGEAGFAIAVDLLWSDLSRAAKRATAAMAMRPWATRSLGLETSRSNSTLSRTPPWGDYSGLAAWLHRVPHPFVADTIHKFYKPSGRRQSPGGWLAWGFSPACLHWAALHRRADIWSIDATPPAVGWAAAADVTMAVDERGQSNTGDFKAFVGTSAQLAAQFGAPSKQNQDQFASKRRLDKQPQQWNPGGLRYLASGQHPLVLAGRHFNRPRYVVGRDVADDRQPTLTSHVAYPGFSGAQVRIDQQLSEQASDPFDATQHLVGLGSALVMRLRTEGGSPNIGFDMPLNAHADQIQTEDEMARWPIRNIEGENAKGTASVQLLGGSLTLRQDAAIRPLLASESIRVWQAGGGSDHIRPSFRMALLRAQLRGEQGWLVTQNQPDQQISRLDNTHKGVSGLILKSKNTWSTVIDIKGDRSSLQVKTPLGPITLEDPDQQMLQVIRVHEGQLGGFHLKAKEASLQGNLLFSADAPARVSYKRLNNEHYLTIDGSQVQLGQRWPARGRSLIDGRLRDLQDLLGRDWLRVY
jgi:hypothetical protein